MTRNSAVADDLLQDVFLRVYPRRHILGPGEVGRYCNTVTRNTTLDYIVRRQRLDNSLPELAYHQTPYDDYVQHERDSYHGQVREAVAQLPARQQQAVAAFLSYDRRSDAARSLGIPDTTLRARQAAAFIRLRRHLRRHHA